MTQTSTDLQLLRDRDAQASIRGFIYQVDLTLLRWIALSEGDLLLPERAEDIDVIANWLNGGDQQLLEQVKTSSTAVTLNSPTVRGALAGFYEHVAANPAKDLQFRFSTNALVAGERPSHFEGKAFGIDVWNGLRKSPDGATSQQTDGIRKTFTDAQKPGDLAIHTWSRFAAFIAEASEVELLRFIRAVEFSCDIGDFVETKTSVTSLLCAAGIVNDTGAAERAYLALFHHVVRLLCGPPPRELRRVDLIVVIKESYPPLPRIELAVQLINERLIAAEVELREHRAELLDHGARLARTEHALAKSPLGRLLPAERDASWLSARGHATTIANELLREALVVAAETGQADDLELVMVYVAGTYDALRIHWLREYRLASRSDAPRFERFLPALLSGAASDVFPAHPWLSEEPKLAEDKHSAGANAESPFSVSDRRDFSELVDSVDLIKGPLTTSTFSEEDLLRLHVRLVDCVLAFEVKEAPILERFGTPPGHPVARNGIGTDTASPSGRTIHDAIKEARDVSTQASAAKQNLAQRLAELLTVSVGPIREAIREHTETLIDEKELKIRMLPLTLGGWNAIGRRLAEGAALEVLRYSCKEVGIRGFDFFLRCGVSLSDDGEPTVNAMLSCTSKSDVLDVRNYLLHADGTWEWIGHGRIDSNHVVETVKRWLDDSGLWGQPET